MRDRNPVGDARREGGFSLVEVVIATAVLFMIIMITTAAINGGNRLLLSTSVEAEAEIKAAQIADQIADRVRQGMYTTLQQVDGSDFPDSEGAATPTVVKSGLRLRLYDRYFGAAVPKKSFQVVLQKGEAFDGKDNNGNQYIDEMNVVLQEWDDDFTSTPARSIVLGKNLQSLEITRYGRRLRIRVNVFRYDPTTQAVRVITGKAEAGIKD